MWLATAITHKSASDPSAFLIPLVIISAVKRMRNLLKIKAVISRERSRGIRAVVR